MDNLSHIVKVLENQVASADAEGVSSQRSRNHEYYTMQPIGNERPGRSKYVSPDVLDAVESAKAMFSETFFTGRQVVKFTPTLDGGSEEADRRTAYVGHQLELNDWTSLFRDGWHDAFVAKRMVVYAEWKEDDATIDIPVNGAMLPQLGAIIKAAEQQEVVLDVETSNLTQAFDNMTGQQTYAGPLQIVVDRSRVDLHLVAPETFYRDPSASYAHCSSFCTWERRKPRYELIEMGFDPDQVMKLKSEYRIRNRDEDASRKAHDESRYSFYRKQGANSQQEVSLYTTCTWLSENDIDPDAEEGGASKLFRIYWSQGEILSWKDGSPAVEEIDSMPFFEWTEYKISHAEHGMSVADILAHTQKVQSTLKRLIIDNQQMRNTTRYEAVHGAIKNPRDLLENRIGGVVWTRQIGSVAPLQTPELSPLTLAAIEMLQRDSEARSGMSALSKGMNADAISQQNAADMIQRLTNAGNRRVMRAARDFANTFLIPLCKYIYRLGVRNDRRSHALQVSGKFQMISPSKWPDSDMPMHAIVALTPEEAARHGQMLISMHMMMKDDPAMATMYGASQRHALISDAFDSFGVADTTRYLLKPDSPEFATAQQAQQAQAMKQEAMQEAMTQLQMNLAISDDKRKWFDTQVKKLTEENRQLDRKYDNAQDTEEFNWRRKMDLANLTLEKEKLENEREAGDAEDSEDSDAGPFED